jgi:hypothetical protein
VIGCCCPVCGDLSLQRQRMKRLLLQLEREHPGVKASLLKALGNVMPRHLLDRRLNPARAGEPEPSTAAIPGGSAGMSAASFALEDSANEDADLDPSRRRESDDRARVIPLIVPRAAGDATPGDATPGGTALQGCATPAAVRRAHEGDTSIPAAE